jgi:hypothetical protein
MIGEKKSRGLRKYLIGLRKNLATVQLIPSKAIVHFAFESSMM